MLWKSYVVRPVTTDISFLRCTFVLLDNKHAHDFQYCARACVRVRLQCWCEKIWRMSKDSIAQWDITTQVMRFLGSSPTLCWNFFHTSPCILYCCDHGNRDTSLSLRGINPRLSSVEPDLGPPLTINVLVLWVVFEPQTPPSQPRVPVSAV